MHTNHHKPGENPTEEKSDPPLSDSGTDETANRERTSRQQDAPPTGNERSPAQEDGRDAPPAGSKRDPDSPWLGGG